MAQNPPEGYQRMIPYILYRDAPAALDFLGKAFGFEERMRMPGEDGKITHAEVAYDGNAVMLATVPETEGARFSVQGVYREAVAPERLVWTNDLSAQGTGGSDELVVSVRFAKVEGGTEVRITHMGFPDKAMRDDHSEGWSMCLDQLERLLG